MHFACLKFLGVCSYRAIIFLQFKHIFEVVSRYRDPQLQVTENKFNLKNLG